MTVWAGAVALLVVLGWLELRRSDRRHLALRLLGSVVAVTSLALLMAPPSLPARAGAGGVALVVTPGTPPAVRKRLVDSLPGVPLLVWPDSIADLDALRLRFPGIRTVVVTGWGLRASFLDRVHDLEVRRYPAPPRPGFQFLDAPRQVRLGDGVVIRGRTVPDGQRRLARFEGPAGERDSADIPPDSARLVAFRATPAAVGIARFVVALPPEPAETLSVVVLPRRPPAVLVLEGAPAFETTFLRRWLAAQGARIVVRTRISRDRDRIDRVNAPAGSLRPLTAPLLDQFDVVLADGPTLAALSGAERNTLAGAIEDRGLGLLVAADSAAGRDPAFFPFRMAATGDIDDRLVRPLWPGRSDRSTTPVPAAAAALEPVPAMQVMMRDPVGRILAGAVRRGAGWIGTSVVLAPSRWLLEEEPAPYAGYWSTLLGRLARLRDDQWSALSDGPVLSGLPVTLTLVSDDPLPLATVTTPAGSVDTLGLVQDLTDPARWWGRYWPAGAGLHAAANRDRQSYPFVVEARESDAREAAARTAATAWWSEESEPPSTAPTLPRREPLGPLGPFVALVIALGVLWGESRGVSGRL